MFNKLKKKKEKEVKKQIAKEKKFIDENSIEGQLTAELGKEHGRLKLNPIPEKTAKIKELREQFAVELSACEDEFYKGTRELELRYMRTELKILKEKVLKEGY